MSSYESLIVCGGMRFVSGVEEYFAKGKSVEVTTFLAAQECREYVYEQVSKGNANTQRIVVLIGPGVNDVEGINLCAALRNDLFCGLVLLVTEHHTESFASRAHIAGASISLGIDSLEQVLHETFGIAISKSEKSIVFAVTSARGGSGKTFFSCASAYACAEQGYKTALVDLDFLFGDLSAYVGLDAPLQLIDCTSEQSFLSVRNPVTSNLDAYISSRAAAEGERLSPRINELLKELRLHYEVVIVDTSSNWGEAFVSLMPETDCCVCVIDASAGAVTAAKRASDVLIKMGVQRSKLSYVVNKSAAKRCINAHDIESVFRVSKAFEIPDSGRIIADLCDVGGLAEFVHMKDPAYVAIKSCMGDVLASNGFNKNTRQSSGKSAQRSDASVRSNVGKRRGKSKGRNNYGAL